MDSGIERQLRKIRKKGRTTEADLHRFEQEYRRETARRFGKIVLTENWMLRESGMAACVLPLKEIVWVYHMPKISKRFGDYYDIHLCFRNGARFLLDCYPGALSPIMKLLAERCPNAQFDEYSWKRKREWKEEAKQWRTFQ